MIPTYNNVQYLPRTIESVLCQATEPDDMQIEVIDTGSTTDTSEKLVKELGQGRIAFHRLATNRGSTQSCNTCIERSRGQWIHILHDDDMVLPGFYEAYRAMSHSQPEARMILGQSITIDEADRWTGLYGPQPPRGGGILADFLEQQATQQLVLFPSVVVRRDAYEELGGFCALFEHVDDWDMWFRLALSAPVACAARPYALCRFHDGSDTSQRQATAANVQEWYSVVVANLARLGKSASIVEHGCWQRRLAEYAEEVARRLDRKKCTEGSYIQARWAWTLGPTLRRLRLLLKTWLKHKLCATSSFWA
jgi:GT2 family glycosyltransferase